MKVIPILLLTLLCLSFIVISPPSIRSLYALNNKVGRYGIVTIDSVKSKFWSFNIHIWRKEGEKIKDNPDHINTTATQLRHTFKWNVDDLPQDVEPGTQWISCIELKAGKVNIHVLQTHLILIHSQTV